MKSYLLMLAGAILLSSLVSILISDGKMGKFIKGMTRLFVFSLVVVPLLSLFGKREFTFSISEISEDEEYLEFCNEALAQEDEAEIEGYLLKEYSLKSEAEVVWEIGDTFTRKKILVKITDAGIFGQEEHIDIIEKIIYELEEKYDCKTEVIWEATE